MEAVQTLKNLGPGGCANLLAPIVQQRSRLYEEVDKKSLQYRCKDAFISALFNASWEQEEEDTAQTQTVQPVIRNIPWCLEQTVRELFDATCRGAEDVLPPIHWKLIDLMLRNRAAVNLDVKLWANEENAEAFMTGVSKCSPQLEKLMEDPYPGMQDDLRLFSNSDTNPRMDNQVNLPRRIYMWKKSRILGIKYAVPRNNQQQETTSADIWENIEELTLHFPIRHFEALDAAKMEGLTKLKKLHIKLLCSPQYNTKDIIPKLMQVVQKLPPNTILGSNALQSIGACVEFVVKFATENAGKVLVVEDLRIGPQFERLQWSPLLKVKNVSLCSRGHDMGMAIQGEDLLMGRPFPMWVGNVEGLQLGNFPSLTTCSLVESLAATLTRLDILCRVCLSLDLHKVLIKGPNIIDLQLNLGEFFQVDVPTQQVDDAFFKKMKRFVCVNAPDNDDEVMALFTAFLLNSEAYHELDIRNLPTLETTLVVLEQHPKCCTRLRRLVVETGEYALRTWFNMGHHALDLAALLALRSPYLKEVEFRINISATMPALPTAECQWFKDVADSLGIKFELKELTYEY